MDNKSNPLYHFGNDAVVGLGENPCHLMRVTLRYGAKIGIGTTNYKLTEVKGMPKNRK